MLSEIGSPFNKSAAIKRASLIAAHTMAHEEAEPPAEWTEADFHFQYLHKPLFYIIILALCSAFSVQTKEVWDALYGISVVCSGLRPMIHALRYMIKDICIQKSDIGLKKYALRSNLFETIYDTHNMRSD